MARIVFMGTPDFAVPSLGALVNSGNDIVGVFTRPDQPAGRGRQLASSPIKQLAEARGFAVFQPKTFRKSEVIDSLRALRPDLAIVAAYGIILPAEALAVPMRGFVNTHASLLPRHRGAAPIAAAILAGDSETGITLMQMDPGLDTGPILAQRAIPIAPDDTTATLTPKLAHLAAEMLTDDLPRILSGELTPIPQDETGATLFKTMKKEEGLLDWTRPADELARRVRAFNPWPSAYTFWNGKQIKILSAQPVLYAGNAEPGRVMATKEGIVVAAGRGGLRLDQVQLAGKRAMEAGEFVRGQRDFVNARLAAATLPRV